MDGDTCHAALHPMQAQIAMEHGLLQRPPNQHSRLDVSLGPGHRSVTKGRQKSRHLVPRGEAQLERLFPARQIHLAIDGEQGRGGAGLQGQIHSHGGALQPQPGRLPQLNGVAMELPCLQVQGHADQPLIKKILVLSTSRQRTCQRTLPGQLEIGQQGEQLEGEAGKVKRAWVGALQRSLHAQMQGPVVVGKGMVHPVIHQPQMQIRAHRCPHRLVGSAVDAHVTVQLALQVLELGATGLLQQGVQALQTLLCHGQVAPLHRQGFPRRPNQQGAQVLAGAHPCPNTLQQLSGQRHALPQSPQGNTVKISMDGPGLWGAWLLVDSHRPSQLAMGWIGQQLPIQLQLVVLVLQIQIQSMTP